MGNILRGFFDGERRRRIRVMKVDGKIMKLSSPVYVKEIVENHPDHGIFDADVVHRQGIHSRPLPEREELHGGRLYFLIPLPPQAKRASSEKTLDANSRLRRLHMFHEAFSNGDSTKGEFDRKLRIVSSSEDGSSVRLKLRLRKDELAELLPRDGKSAAAELMEKDSGGSISRPPRCGWRSNLDSITELKTPCPDPGGL